MLNMFKNNLGKQIFPLRKVGVFQMNFLKIGVPQFTKFNFSTFSNKNIQQDMEDYFAPKKNQLVNYVFSINFLS